MERERTVSIPVSTRGRSICSPPSFRRRCSTAPLGPRASARATSIERAPLLPLPYPLPPPSPRPSFHTPHPHPATVLPAVRETHILRPGFSSCVYSFINVAVLPPAPVALRLSTPSFFGTSAAARRLWGKREQGVGVSRVSGSRPEAAGVDDGPHLGPGGAWNTRRSGWYDFCHFVRG